MEYLISKHRFPVLVLTMPLYKMLDKAERLLKAGRIERLDSGHYNVIGDHGTYTIVVRERRVYCTCPGFKEKGVCSHGLAVMKMMQGPRNKY
jgi:uncharacterized Zn finger protein